MADDSPKFMASVAGVEAVSFFTETLGPISGTDLGNASKGPVEFFWQGSGEEEDEEEGVGYSVSLAFDANGVPKATLLFDVIDRTEEYVCIGYCVANGIEFTREYRPTSSGTDSPDSDPKVKYIKDHKARKPLKGR